MQDHEKNILENSFAKYIFYNQFLDFWSKSNFNSQDKLNKTRNTKVDDMKFAVHFLSIMSATGLVHFTNTLDKTFLVEFSFSENT